MSLPKVTVNTWPSHITGPAPAQSLLSSNHFLGRAVWWPRAWALEPRMPRVRILASAWVSDLTSHSHLPLPYHEEATHPGSSGLRLSQQGAAQAGSFPWGLCSWTWMASPAGQGSLPWSCRWHLALSYCEPWALGTVREWP